MYNSYIYTTCRFILYSDSFTSAHLDRKVRQVLGAEAAGAHLPAGPHCHLLQVQQQPLQRRARRLLLVAQEALAGALDGTAPQDDIYDIYL